VRCALSYSGALTKLFRKHVWLCGSLLQSDDKKRFFYQHSHFKAEFDVFLKKKKSIELKCFPA